MGYKKIQVSTFEYTIYDVAFRRGASAKDLARWFGQIPERAKVIGVDADKNDGKMLVRLKLEEDLGAQVFDDGDEDGEEEDWD